MALTKYDVASAALVMIGAAPVASFDAAGSAESVACFHLYQSSVNNWLSLHPWRFATRTVQMARVAAPPLTKWQNAYQQPADLLAMQAIRLDANGSDIPYDRFENKVMCNAGDTQAVYCVYSYEPPVAWWPGYFVSLMELALALKFSFALSGKLDLRSELEEATATSFRYAKNADSRQQTSRRFKVHGRGSIIEARRA
jgi:hypothetical protein